MKYTRNFKNLIKNQKERRSLIKGSSFINGNLNQWVMARSFISNVIHKRGTILDVGCGNGFFLRCMQEWSKYELNPYGIDIKEGLIKEARELFLKLPNNFISIPLNNIDKIPKSIFPNKFDFIYWNVWNDCQIKEDMGFLIFKYLIDDKNKFRYKEIELKKLLDKVKKGGRLILGFYDFKKEDIKKINMLKISKYNFSKILSSPKRQEVIAYINK